MALQSNVDLRLLNGLLPVSSVFWQLLPVFSFASIHMGCPNKSTRFKVYAIVVLLGWRHWKFNICHLSLLRLVVMERRNKEQSVIIVKTHYKYGESYAETVRKFCGIFGRQNAPYQSTVKEWIRNSRKEVRLWTVNYPCVIVPAGLSTTLPQCVEVLLRV